MKIANSIKTKFLPLVGYMLLICICQQVNAQSFSHLVSELRKKYETADKLHVVMDIVVFESNTATTPYFSEHADIKRDGTNYKYQMESNELLMNNQFLIMVDKNTKEILFGTRDLQTEAQLPDPFKMNIDSIFNIIGQPQFVSNSGGRDHYKFSQPEGLIAQIDLFFNTEKKFMEEIKYLYREGQVASIKINV